MNERLLRTCLVFAGGFAVAFGGVSWLTRKSSPSTGPVVGRFLGKKLVKGQTYRILLRSGSESTVRPGLAAIGFDVLLVTKDPSQRDVFTALGTWNLSESEIRRAAMFAILDITQVEKPPAEDPAAPTVRGCDPGLTRGELDAVRYALREDVNPKHLGGFGATFEPDYPAVASMLRVKGSLVQLRALGVEKTAERQAKAAALQAKFMEGCKLPLPFDLWTHFVLVDPVSALAEGAKGLGAGVEKRVMTLRAKLPVTPSPYRMWVLAELGKGTVSPTPELVLHYALLPGETPEAKAKALREAPVMAHVQALAALLAKEPESAKDVRSLLTKFLKEGALLRRSAQDLASTYRISEPAARAAIACVLDLGEAGRLVNGVLLAELLPNPPPRPTPSALTLASTTLRPTLSTVTDPKVAVQRSLQVVQAAEGGNADAKAARSQLGRAVKTLERAKWVRWYKKVGA